MVANISRTPFLRDVPDETFRITANAIGHRRVEALAPHVSYLSHIHWRLPSLQQQT